VKTLKQIERALARFEGWFIIALLSEMIGLTFIQVLLRNLHIHGRIQQANLLLGQIDWAEPLVRLSVLWVTFLGASLLTAEKRHIKIDILSSVLTARWLPWREAIVSLAAALVCGLMFAASLEYVGLEYRSGTTLFLGIPSWVTQLILPAGFLLILLRFLFRAAEEVTPLFRGSIR
jgi:TRAP-type C4-dicarboxylate transport system permease small subunit